MTLRFDFDYQPREQFRVQRLVAGRDAHAGLSLALATGMLLLGIGLQFAGAGFEKTWYVFLFPLFVFIIVPLLQLRIAYAHGRHHALPHTQHTIEVSASGVRLECVAGASEVRWPALLRIQETADFILFYPRPRVAFYLPKRVVTEPRQLDTLRAALVEWAPDKTELETRQRTAA